MADETEVTNQDDQQNDTDDATGQGGDDTGQQNGGEKPEAQFTQADVDRIVTERLEREKAKAESKAQRAREEAEAKALADQEKWKELAEKNSGKLAEIEADLSTKTGELETITERAQRLEKALTAQLEAVKDGLPEPVLELVNRLDLVDQLEYLAKHRDTLAAKNGAGVPASPKAADGEAASKEQRQQSARSLGAQIRNWM